MFGDFFQNFGLNFPFLGADRAGGVFGGTVDPEKAMQNVLGGHHPHRGEGAGMPGAGMGAGMGPGGPQMLGGRPGEEQAPGASTVAQPPPTASGVAQPPMTIGSSPLGPGGGSPLGPGQQPQAADRLAPGGELAELLRKLQPGGGIRAQ